MKRKLSFVFAAPLLLGFSAAWTQEEEAPELPPPAADEARDAAALPEAAADGLARAAEATIRLMEDDDHEVTHDLELPELPELPEAGAAGQRGQEVAGQAIAGGRDFGQDKANEARDAARDAAEGRGRAEDLPGDVPGRPDDVPGGRPDDVPGGRPDDVPGGRPDVP